MRILVIGDSCTDRYIYTKSSRLSPEAPVPVLNPVRIIDDSGMAGNVARNLFALDAHVGLITNTSKILKTRFVDDHTNQMFIRYDETDIAEPIGDRLKEIDFTDNIDAVIISDYNKGFLSTTDIAWISKQHDLTFMDTKKDLGTWAKDICFIKVNVYEYTDYMRGDDRSLSPNIITTLGKSGCTYNGKKYLVDEVEVKDLAGAGDTFLAGLAVEYIRSGDMDKALTFANECATIVVQKRGVCTV